ncbi:TetR/AcrR family transcriptional regulator [Phenylobacterium sp.]|jgi:AcrR family transcriptional regulator|uniref:TetR/AcrR family transcriptional regulator n=1 Tax=Phenylobacterium sp. TaxID=1871053 RepID=UPI002E354B9D|nr:TetR/AcrR family transcriptional regulator [Phenylobacterium sp.]HEX3365397.1 TetR/AcrR family transcriptional regulator [Phenylobacterium sp.]
MATAPRTTSRPEKGVARQRQIRLAASRLFVQQGYDGTSMQDIADAVGLTKPGLYHFVESKEELLSAIVDDGVERLEREVIEPARAIKDPEARLAAMIRLHVDNISHVETDVGNPVTALVENLIGLSDERRSQMEGRLRQVFEVIRGALDELKAEGRLADGLDPTVSAFSIIGMVMWTNRWRRPGGRLSAAAVADSIVALALHGVLKD